MESSEEVVREWLEDPRIDDMLECAHRACLRIADVTVMHSVTTSDTGSMATVMEEEEAMVEYFCLLRGLF